MLRKFILLMVVSLLPSSISNKSEIQKFNYTHIIEKTKGELLYDDIWGTIYHAEKKQCDETPLITGDGSKINPDSASSQRWIAICHEMLDDEYRRNKLNDSTSDRFRGKIKYGDTVWIESDIPQINGWWVVHDTKHKRVKNSVDFLQTKGDGRLYSNNKLWSGRFHNLKIYKYTEKFKIILN